MAHSDRPGGACAGINPSFSQGRTPSSALMTFSGEKIEFIETFLVLLHPRRVHGHDLPHRASQASRVEASPPHLLLPLEDEESLQLLVF